MNDLSDLTFIIPIRQDCLERLENVILVTQFLIKNFSTNIKVLESASYKNGLLEHLLDRTIQIDFQEDNDPIFFRTEKINRMAQTVETSFVAVWDSDVLISIDQIVQSVDLLRRGEADFVYPYEKQFLDTSLILRKLFLETGSIQVLEQNVKKMKEMYAPNPIGGAFLANVKAYKESGLENEDFYGWGMEDGERFYRWRNMGFKIRRVPGPLFHLSHGRGINSVFHNADQSFYKRKEVLNVRRNKNVDDPHAIDNQVSIQKTNL